MAARKSAWAPNLLAAVFTSLVAPILVSVAVRNLEPEGRGVVSRRVAARQQAPSPSERTANLSERVSLYPPPPVVTVTEQVLGSGAGATPDDALRDALRNAVRQCLAARLPSLASGDADVMSETVLQEGKTVLRWEERTATTEWMRAVKVYRREMLVTLDSAALDNRVKTVRPGGLRSANEEAWRAPSYQSADLIR
jgi:hypothetical protein